MAQEGRGMLRFWMEDVENPNHNLNQTLDK